MMGVRAACRRAGKLAALLLLGALPACARSAALSLDDPRSPLKLVRKIGLPEARGRIDHMALDLGANRLFVAERSNGSLDVIDLISGKIAGRITGLREPQGVAWLAKQQEVAIACGDGTVSFYRGKNLEEVATIRLGADADNERLDDRNGNLVVGYGSGGLAILDPSTHQIIRRIALTAHPEAFSLIGTQVFVNVPDAHAIALADLDGTRPTTIISAAHGDNYPMASNPTGSLIAVAYRSPGTLAMMDAQQLTTAFSVPACGDADDLFFHSGEIVVVCGEGAVQLISGSSPHGGVRVATQRGARTGLLDTKHNRLFVAVPAGSTPAAVWELSFR